MKTKMLMLALIVAGSIAFTGCKKEGCTDPDATNYDDGAKNDDGNCQYQGEIVFWYDEQTSDSLIADNATALKIYVDNQIEGSYATSVYFTGAPDCGQNSTVTVTKDLGSDKSKTFTYSVKDDTGFEYWSGNTTFVANTCATEQLTW